MRKLTVLFILLLLLSACAQEKNSTMSYDEIKKMMIDSLQTEDGKKALRQLLEEPSFRELLILEHEEVKKATEETLLSKEAEDFWKKTFEDPKFKETVAKSIQKQQQDIMKELMKDPTFQKDLESFFGQPDMQKQLETILKSANLRKQMEEIVKETIESPLMQTKWQELIQKGGGEGDSSKSEDKKDKNSEQKSSS
ncbi:spore germination lipoprotein GerD [Lysinibacillus piscis]|uniref:Spore germination protein GerD n=1 Tax=Lysinibacillus piscis TaxID=2518931 RepID=A0ABQ5NP81_9BACI|nr:spore germination lipoprotein GerD [Lysinibacillus sp. KH24]GLC89928.1 spore germination protein GerD [Lysinibacillus sp. KH24]